MNAQVLYVGVKSDIKDTQHFWGRILSLNNERDWRALHYTFWGRKDGAILFKRVTRSAPLYRKKKYTIINDQDFNDKILYHFSQYRIMEILKESV